MAGLSVESEFDPIQSFGSIGWERRKSADTVEKLFWGRSSVRLIRLGIVRSTNDSLRQPFRFFHCAEQHTFRVFNSIGQERPFMVSLAKVHLQIR